MRRPSQLLTWQELRLYLLLLCAVLLLGSDASGFTYDSLTPEQLAQRANLIVVGKVVAAWHSWDPATQIVYLNCQLQPEQVIKGSANRTVRIMQHAMTASDITRDELARLPIPAIVSLGTRAVAFLVGYKQGTYMLPTDMRSVYPLSGDHLLEHGVPLADFLQQAREVIIGQRQRFNGLRDRVSYSSQTTGAGIQSFWGGQFTTLGRHWARPSSGLLVAPVQYDSLYARRSTSFMLSLIDTCLANWETNIWPAGSPSGRGHFLDFQRQQTVTATGASASCDGNPVVNRIVWSSFGDTTTSATCIQTCKDGDQRMKGFTIYLNKDKPTGYWEDLGASCRIPPPVVFFSEDRR